MIEGKLKEKRNKIFFWWCEADMTKENIQHPPPLLEGWWAGAEVADG